MKLPTKGRPKNDVLAEMRRRKTEDADWRGGRTWSLVYPAGEDVDEVLREANELYVFENALNPFRFPSLRAMEADVVSMTLGLLNGGESAGGTLTSGGTESILMAVKTARDRARAERGDRVGPRPVMLAPVTAHPAFAKAAHYLGLELRQIPLASDLRADVAAARDMITQDVVLVVGSAPNYPHGMIDPISELAALAAEHGASFHTDACVGGFLLPFLEKLGEPIPPFDFRVPGVTTISADVHKYGYATKGVSVIAHREQATLAHQMFLYDAWPGGMYGSPAMAGARPAAPIAAAWAVMSYLGEEGYLRLAHTIRDTTRRLREGISAIPGLRIVGDTPASVLAFTAAWPMSADRAGGGAIARAESAHVAVEIMAVGDVMDDRGWHLDRQKDPDALHMMVTPNHARIVDEFLADLRDAVAKHGPSRGASARYA